MACGDVVFGIKEEDICVFFLLEFFNYLIIRIDVNASGMWIYGNFVWKDSLVINHLCCL